MSKLKQKKSETEHLVFELLCRGDVASSPNITGDFLTFIRRTQQPENISINKDYILPSAHKLAIRFFLMELDTFISKKSIFYDSMLSGIIHGLLGNTSLDKEEWKYYNENRKNKNHWLSHYNRFSSIGSSITNPRVTEKSLQQMYQILVYYNWHKNNESRGIEVQHPSWNNNGGKVN